MILQIVECSPLAELRMPADRTDTVGTEVKAREKYPYSGLAIGYSFTLPLDQVVNEHSFRNMVMAKSKALKKKFTVIKHGEPFNCYEVARIG